ncbi:transmembrane protein 138 isoform X2 [Procambarus clarkii]|uniref:transmembrane protein 138 isoform X2 n=1 Tax=Procambarus clarkii TaxID=6728 RepID=UPI003744ACC5
MARDRIEQYRWSSGAALALLLVDLTLNAIFQVFSHNTLLTLLIYIIQDVCLVFSLILLFLGLFSTTLSQAGLIGELFHKFQWCILVVITYLGLSIGLHSWSLEKQWQKPEVYIWTHGMVSLFTIQRVVSPVMQVIEAFLTPQLLNFQI